MDILKPIFSLTPIGFFVFIIGAILMLAALIFFRDKPEEQQSNNNKPQTTNIDIHIENWICSPPQTITDIKGSKADIQTIVLSNDFSWEFRSYSKVQRHGEPADIKTHLMSPGISEEIRKYANVIAVGAASHEGSQSNPVEESNRANYRADQLQLWIKEYISTSIPVYKLSIGYYKDLVLSEDTSEQRKIVIIGVLNKDESIDLADALRRSLSKNKTFPFDLSKYSSFTLEQSR